MLAEIIPTFTSDQLRLFGALAHPPQPAHWEVDSVLCLHGVGGNFYSSPLFDALTDACLKAGLAVLRVNTRGHDGISTICARKRYGAAFEVVGECPRDIAAWLEVLRQRGYARTALVGHSLGAIKAVYAQAHEPQTQVQAIAAVSPPQLSYEIFASHENPAFLQSLAAAQEQVAADRPSALIEAAFPFPMLISAAGFLDKYGPGERYNVARFAGQVRQPLLFVYGESELARGGVPFEGVPQRLAAIAPAERPFEFAEIAGADHFYTGRQGALAATVVDWLRRRFSREG